jgi:desulfoferrodoxin FeS4 iron-binding domain
MTQKKQIYKCMKCGNIVEVLHEGEGELVCCGEPMKLFVENTTDAAKENMSRFWRRRRTGGGSRSARCRIRWKKSITLNGSSCLLMAIRIARSLLQGRNPKPSSL